MEDAAKAIEMAGAMLIFVIAITIAFLVLGQAKSTSDAVFSATDKTSHYEYVSKEAPNAKTTRIVGIETIIPTFYRYNAESLRIVVIDKNNNIILVLDKEVENMINAMYYKDLPQIIAGDENEAGLNKNTKTELAKLNLRELSVINSIMGTTLTEKKLFGEYVDTYYKASGSGISNQLIPWNTGTNKNINKRIDMIVSGESGKINSKPLDYSNISFFKNHEKSSFEERYFVYKISGQEYIPGVDELEELNSRIEESVELVAVEEKKVIIYKQK